MIDLLFFIPLFIGCFLLFTALVYPEFDSVDKHNVRGKILKIGIILSGVGLLSLFGILINQTLIN